MLVTWWRSRGRLGQDSVLAAIFIAAAFAPPLAANGLTLGNWPAPAGSPGLGAGRGHDLPLAVRRRWPALSLAIIAVAYVIFQLAGYISSFGTVGLIVALYSAGAHAGTRRRALAWAVTAGYAVLAVALALRGSPERPIDWFTFYLLLVVSWGAGSWMRARTGMAAMGLPCPSEGCRVRIPATRRFQVLRHAGLSCGSMPC